MTCAHVTAIGDLMLTCGSAAGVRRYLIGDRCPLHTPAAKAGRPEPGRTATVRPAWFDRAVPPISTSRLIDDRAIASGKRRSSRRVYLEAQARTAGA